MKNQNFQKFLPKIVTFQVQVRIFFSKVQFTFWFTGHSKREIHKIGIIPVQNNTKLTHFDNKMAIYALEKALVSGKIFNYLI